MLVALVASSYACAAPSEENLFGSRGGAGADAAGGSSGAHAGAGAGGATEAGGTAGGGVAGSEAPAGSSEDAGFVPIETGLAEVFDAGLDATASAPNPLGCSAEDVVNCNGLVATLAHRYSFDGTGTQVVDSIGSEHGSLEATELSGDGSADLLGDGGYLNLPNGIISALTSGTFEIWLDWAGGDAWQRIFDFGSNDEGEDERGAGEEYIFLTATASSGNLRVTFLTDATGGEVEIDAPGPLPDGVETHVAVVVDANTSSMALFLNGQLQGSVAVASDLSAIDDVNNWLGLSQFENDPSLAGSLLEFRIYAAALSDEQIELSFDLGPDAPSSL